MSGASWYQGGVRVSPPRAELWSSSRYAAYLRARTRGDESGWAGEVLFDPRGLRRFVPPRQEGVPERQPDEAERHAPGAVGGHQEPLSLRLVVYAAIVRPHRLPSVTTNVTGWMGSKYIPFVTPVRAGAGAPRSRPPPGSRLPRRSPALRPDGRCRCGRRATRPGL